MNIKYLFMVTLTAGILLQSCGSEKKTKESAEAVPVQAETVTSVKVPKTFYYSGNVSSLKKSTLSTRIMGQIDKVLVHEGDKVKQGQLLVSIKSNDIVAQKSQVESNIIAAEAAYKNAESDYKRITTLFKSKSATQKELDDITTHYKMTKAQLEAAKNAKEQVEENLAYANITAPYDGVITDRFVDGGDMANPGMPLVAIESPGKFEVITRIPESEVNMVKKNDTVFVELKSTQDKISGIITNISPSSRFSGSQFEARIIIDPSESQKKEIRSGMFANVILAKGTTHKILVPTSLIINRGQLTGVWTVGETGNALLRWVRLGKTFEDKTEVLSGLSENDKLITGSDSRLYDGMLVSLQ